MKLAHVAVVTPKRCGLWETTRELVAAERKLGVDARVVDPKPIPELYPKGGHDRGVPLADMEWATKADLIVSHSGHAGTPLSTTEQPIIHVAHGRPLSTFLAERADAVPGYSYHVVKSQTERYRACVTFWPEYEPILRALWRGKPIHVIQPPVDLDYWTTGSTDYDFGGKAGEYNIVMTDPWSRVDVSPFHALHAFALFRHRTIGAKLHIFAADANQRGFSALFRVLGDSLGIVQGWAADLRLVYRAADMLITPHRIYTRAIRESMATGCQVVSGRDADPEDVEGFAIEMMGRKERPAPTAKMAAYLFDPAKTATQFLELAAAVAA